MLFEWFQKRQQPRPKIDVLSEGRTRFRATVTVSGGLVYDLPDGEAFDRKAGAEQAAATQAIETKQTRAGELAVSVVQVSENPL